MRRSYQKRDEAPPGEGLFFEGTIKKVLYKGDTSWGIILVEAKDKYVQTLNAIKPPERNTKFFNPPEVIKCVGNFPTHTPGVGLEIKGYWKTDPKFGLQFSATSIQMAENVISDEISRDSLVRLLSSISGIGPSRAGAIADAYRGDMQALSKDLDAGGKATEENCREVISPKIIALIPADVAIKMCKEWKDISKKAGILGFLYNLDIGGALADRILDTYSNQNMNYDQIKSLVTSNPYRLADDIWGISFTTADKIALALGISPDSPYRKISCVSFLLDEAAREGHTWLTTQQLAADVLKTIGRPMIPLEVMTDPNYMYITSESNFSMSAPQIPSESLDYVNNLVPDDYKQETKDEFLPFSAFVESTMREKFVVFKFTSDPRSSTGIAKKEVALDEVKIARKFLAGKKIKEEKEARV